MLGSFEFSATGKYHSICFGGQWKAMIPKKGVDVKRIQAMRLRYTHGYTVANLINEYQRISLDREEFQSKPLNNKCIDS